MALSTKTIKRRIKSIANTKKITKAMEMISAVKMRRAVANASATRNYAELAWQMLQDVVKQAHVSLHPLLVVRPVKKIGLILITSNRGLAGGFTSKLLQDVHNHILETKKTTGAEVEVIVMGRKGKKIYQNFGHVITAEFEKIDLTNQIAEILPIADLVAREYEEGKYDQIEVAYMDFISAIRQEPRIKQIFPLRSQSLVGQVLPAPTYDDDAADEIEEPVLKFEPNPTKVLHVLLPRLVEMQLYRAVLESDASEHSARMMAMQAASDAASDMIKELNTTFNNARQAAITKEIAEVIGGAAALE
jgi:F-type H+-transporting ATPase subunit gamma